ncbi:MAG: hypothetical protein K2M12_09905, partial [Muribaculaceae bacterium]|nr:hypothetical protein [Muribaculaceae bacterium]
FEITQVECRRRYARKLGVTLERYPEWLFPSVLSGEQSTSDLLATFHAGLVPEDCRMADLTAGLGIDVLHCAATAAEITALEMDEERAALLNDNLRRGGVENVRVVCADCREWIKEYEGPKFDMIFIDPARRDADGGRVFALNDCNPDVVAMLPDLRRCTDRALIKMSPMLDISAVLDTLPDCVHMYVLGTATECKELLALLDFAYEPSDPSTIMIEAITATKQGHISFSCTRREEMVADAVYGRPRPGDYVCEPYPAVMKAGAVRLVSERFHLQKLAPNTHVYFAPEHVAGFPGEQRRVEEVLPYASRVLKRFSRNHDRIDVAARNFGITAEAGSAKLGVRNGGDRRLLAVTDAGNEKLLIVLSPLESDRKAD